MYDRALSSADVAAHFAEIADGDHEGYGSLVAGDGARGHWRMDENEGDVALDETGSFPGQYRGTPTFAQPGATATAVVAQPEVTLGQSVGFSGDDDVVVPGVGSELAGDSTWEVWVKPEDFDQRRVLLGKAYGGEGVLTLETTGRVYFFQGSAGANRAPFDVVRSNGTCVRASGTTWW